MTRDPAGGPAAGKRNPLSRLKRHTKNLAFPGVIEFLAFEYLIIAVKYNDWRLYALDDMAATPN